MGHGYILSHARYGGAECKYVRPAFEVGAPRLFLLGAHFPKTKSAPSSDLSIKRSMTLSLTFMVSAVSGIAEPGPEP